MIAITQATRPEQVQAARELMHDLTSWVFTLDADSGQAPTFEGLENELATLPGIFGPPTGALLVATHAGEAAGCVALKQVDSATAELKRMYVRSRFRGSGIGKQLAGQWGQSVSGVSPILSNRVSGVSPILSNRARRYSTDPRPLGIALTLGLTLGLSPRPPDRRPLMDAAAAVLARWRLAAGDC